MDAFVISMDTPTGRSRMNRLSAQCDKIGLRYQLVRGVDPRTLSATDLEAGTTPWCHRTCTAGMIGCGMSHISIWKQIVDRDLPYALILEDDVVLSGDFMARARKALEDVPQDFHVLLLGCFLCSEARQKMSVHRTKTYGSVRDLVAFGGTHAYVVSRAGARYLLDKSPKVSTHIDIQMSNIPGLKLFATRQDIARQPVGTDDSATASVGFPETANAMLSRIPVSKNLTASNVANVGLARVGSLESSVSLTNWHLIFWILGCLDVPWKWIVLCGAADISLASRIPAADDVLSKIAAFAIGKVASSFLIRRTA